LRRIKGSLTRPAQNNDFFAQMRSGCSGDPGSEEVNADQIISQLLGDIGQQNAGLDHDTEV